MELEKTLEENFVEEFSHDKSVEENDEKIDFTEKPSLLRTYFEILKKFVLVFIGLIVFGFFFIDTNDEIFAFAGQIGVLSFVFFKKREWLKSLFNKPSQKLEKKVLNKALFILIFVPLAINLIHYLVNKESFNSSMANYENSFYTGVDFFTIINLVIMAPLCEEIFFRGYIFNKLKTIHKPLTAIIISAIIFAVVHGTLIQQLSVWVDGCIYAYFFYRTGNIKLSIVGHFIGNLAALFSIYVGFYKFNENWNFLIIGLELIILYFVLHKVNNEAEDVLTESVV